MNSYNIQFTRRELLLLAGASSLMVKKYSKLRDNCNVREAFQEIFVKIEKILPEGSIA